MFIKQLTRDLSLCTRELGWPCDAVSVTYSDRPDLCQFQCNAPFRLAKDLRRPPMAVAAELAEEFGRRFDYAQAAPAAPGFLNFTVTDAAFSRLLADWNGDGRCGVETLPEKKTIVIDYGGPNIAKPLHVGHLRSAVIGESLKRLARFLGDTVYGDVHLGDWGTQMGLVIAGLEERYDLTDCLAGKAPAPAFTLDDLNEIYPQASARSKTDEDFRARAQEITLRLQNKEEGYYKLWEDICKVSVSDIRRDYKALDVEFDLWYGESTCSDCVDPILDDMEARGLLYESEGAMVMDVALPDEKKPMPPILLRKSNGARLYASTDVATLYQRQKEFSPDEVWYVVDARQALHFEQIFRCVKKAGIVPESTRLVHVPFGTVNGKDGKPFKTREGGTMKLKDLIAMLTDAAGRLLSPGAVERDPEAARKVGCAALKFGDLVCNRTKNYIFDLDKFLQFDGKTGSYLLYTLVRIRSLLAKAGADGSQTPPEISTREEREVLMKLQMLASSYRQAYDEKLPNYICEAVYDLANAYNVFYGSCRILSEENAAKKNTWLALSRAVGDALAQTLFILGIEPVPAM